MDINALAEQNDIEGIKKLLDSGVNIDTERTDGRTSLLIACLRGYFDLVKLLIERGADKTHKNKKGSNAIIHAVFSGNIQIVQYLYEKGCDPSIGDNEDKNCLHFACQKGFLNIIQYLVDICKINVNSVTKDGRSALHFACISKQKPVVMYLIEQGLNVNLCSLDGRSCIFTALSLGCIDICEYLRVMKANLYIVDSLNESLIHIAINTQNIFAVKWALENISLSLLPIQDISQFDILASKTLNHDIMTLVDLYISPPPAPSGLTLIRATQTTLYLAITCELPTNVPPYVEFEVQKNTSFFGIWETAISEYSKNEIYIVNLLPKTKYNIHIRGRNSNGWSSYSRSFEFKTTNVADAIQSPIVKTPVNTVVTQEIIQDLSTSSNNNDNSNNNENSNNNNNNNSTNTNIPSSTMPISTSTTSIQTTNISEMNNSITSSVLGVLGMVTTILPSTNTNDTSSMTANQIASLNSLKEAEAEEQRKKQEEDERIARDEHMFYCVANHKLDELNDFYEKKFSLHIHNPAGLTLLHSACKYNDKEIASFLIDTVGLDVNEAASTGFLPIHFAIFAGNNELFEYIHSKGGDLHATTNTGLNSLLIAASKADQTIFDYIYNISTEEEKNSKDDHGRNALILGVNSKSLSFVQHLIDLNYNIHFKYSGKNNAEGWNILYFPIYNKDEPMLDYLLQKGVSPVELATNGTNPLSFANSQNASNSIVTLLLKYSTSPLPPILLDTVTNTKIQSSIDLSSSSVSVTDSTLSDSVSITCVVQVPLLKENYIQFINDSFEIKIKKNSIFASWQSISESINSKNVNRIESDKDFELYNIILENSIQYDNKYKIKIRIHNGNAWSDYSLDKDIFIEKPKVITVPSVSNEIHQSVDTIQSVSPLETPHPSINKPIFTPVQTPMSNNQKIDTLSYNDSFIDSMKNNVILNNIELNKLKTIYKINIPTDPYSLITEDESEKELINTKDILQKCQKEEESILLSTQEKEDERMKEVLKMKKPDINSLFDSVYSKDLHFFELYTVVYPDDKYDYYDDKGLSLLHIAVLSNNIKLVTFFVTKGININIKSKSIMETNQGTINKTQDTQEIISNLDTNTNNDDDNNNNNIITKSNIFDLTPLHLACIYGNNEIIEYLLSQKADIYARDSNNTIPAFYLPFAPSDTTLCLKTFIHQGFNVNFLNTNLASILHIYCSISYTCTQVMMELYKANCDMNAIDQQGRNALHYSAISGNIYTYIWLKTHGCKEMIRDNNNYLPLDLAIYYKHDAILEINKNMKSVPLITCPPVIHVLKNNTIHILLTLNTMNSFGIPPITEISIETAKYPSVTQWESVLNTNKTSVYLQLSKGSYICRYKCRNSNGWSSYSPVSLLFNMSEISSQYNIQNFEITPLYLYLQEYNLECIYITLLQNGITDIDTFVNLKINEIQSLNIPVYLESHIYDLLHIKPPKSTKSDKDISNWFKFN